jgi:hypothetical protein
MLFFSMVCIAVCIVINLRFLRLKSYNILDMEQEYSEEFSVCNVEQDYPCVCCSGAYDSFDSIDSVIEENQKVKNVEGIETASNEKPGQQRKSKGPATQEQIEERRRFEERRFKPVDKLKEQIEQIAVLEERRAFRNDDDGSVHSEDGLDLLTTTHV